MLSADGKADCVRLNILICKLFLGKLAVRSRRRMDNKTFCVCNICKQRENLKIVDEFVSFFDSALDFKGED